MERELHITGRRIVSISSSEGVLISKDSDGNEKKYNISGITTLECGYNQLTSLPVLPKELITLCCYENQLTSLPALPEGLKTLFCFGNQLTSLPKLPEGLKGLNCNGNHLTSLPVIPKELKALDCSGNRLVYVQYLRMRPWSYIVPKSLKKKHSKRYYQKNYVLQTLSRYLVCFFTYRSKYCNTFRIFETILSETLL